MGGGSPAGFESAIFNLSVGTNNNDGNELHIMQYRNESSKHIVCVQMGWKVVSHMRTLPNGLGGHT